MQYIKLVFKGGKSQKFESSTVHYLENRDGNVDFALNGHTVVPELEEFQYSRPGSYRIPQDRLKWSGFQS
jgi:hypothetical protein